MSGPSLAQRARTVAAAVIDHIPSGGAKPLAAPPPGSGLQPVMGDPGVPVVGNSLGFLQDTLGHARDFYARFGTVSWSNTFGTKLVFVLGPDGIETVLSNKDRAFANKEGWEYFIGPFF